MGHKAVSQQLSSKIPEKQGILELFLPLKTNPLLFIFAFMAKRSICSAENGRLILRCECLFRGDEELSPPRPWSREPRIDGHFGVRVDVQEPTSAQLLS